MLNNKNDLSMIPTINNDGNSYIIPMDMYKEGYWAYNISNYFKARVDDSGTPFMIRWYKHGQLANVLNLRPFIRGRVGGYTIDDSDATADPKIVMDENASSVDWTGETTDTQVGGIAIYRTINQCYPQDGIFYGQVGLRSSDGDTVVTGIDIIFKVLDGNINMLGAKKYYVSELTKALLTFEAKMDQHDRDYQAKLTQQEQEYQAKMDQNDKDFKSKTDQLIADARAAYTKETQNTHDALTAAQAQIQANRDEQANLSNRLAGTEQQIKIHDVATLDQFTMLSKQALERLSSIGAQPKYYDTVNAMKSANPNGTNDLCETVDDGHRWLYINGVWQDCGAVQDNAFKAARDASQDILYGQDIRNWEKGAAGTIVEATEEFAKYQDKPIIHLKSISSEDYTYVQSGWFSIKEPTISIQFPEMVKDLSAQGIVKMEIHQLKATEDQNDSSTWNANTKWIVFDSEQNSNMKLFKYEELKLNPDTVKIQIRLEIQGGTGSAYIGTPLINVGSRCIAYSPLELAQSLNDSQTISFEQVQNASQNLLYGQSIRDWNKIISGIEEQASSDSVRFHDTPIIHIKEIMAGEWNHWTSDPVKVEHDTVSLQLPNMVQNGIYGATTTYISVIALKSGQKWDDANVNAQNFSLTNAKMGLSKFENIKLPPETDSVVLDIVQQGVGDLYFGIPVLNYGISCIPYDPTDVANSFEDTDKLINDKFNTVKKQSFNLLYAGDIQQWTSNIQGKSEVSHEADVQFDNLPIIHMSGDKKEIWNHWISPVIPINNLTLSLQIPEKMTGEYKDSSAYVSVIPLAKGEKYTDDSTAAKTITLGLWNAEMGLSKFENIKLPEDTVSVVLDIVQQGIADLYFGIPALNYGDFCIPYNPVDITRMIKDATKQSQNNFNKVKTSIGDLLFGEDITQWSNTINGSYTLTSEEYEGSPIIHMSGDKKDIWNHWVSPVIPVKNLTLSLQIPEKMTGQYGASSVYVSVVPLAKGEKYTDTSTAAKTITLGLWNAEMGLSKFENIKLPDDTIGVVLDIVQQGIGDLYFGKPSLNYGDSCIPYDHLDITRMIKDVTKQDQNSFAKIKASLGDLLFGEDITQWSNTINGSYTLTSEEYEGSPIIHMSGTTKDVWNHWISPTIPVTSLTLSLQLPEMASGVYGSSSSYIVIVPLAAGEKYGDSSTNDKTITLGTKNSTMGLAKFENINLPSGTVSVVLDIIQQGIGDLYFGKPCLNYGDICIPYTPVEITRSLANVTKESQDKFDMLKGGMADLLFGEDVRKWTNTINGTYEIVQGEEGKFDGSPIIHMSGTTKEIYNHWISPVIPVTSLTLSLQLPEKSSGVYGSSASYIGVVPLAEGEKYGDSSTASKVLIYGIGNEKMELSKIENIKLPADTVSVIIDITQQGISDLYFGKPVLNYGDTCVAYNQALLAEQQSESSAYMPQLYICSTSSSFNYGSAPVAFRFIRPSGTVKGYLNFDVQGDTSREYTKKNMKLKLFKDSKGKEKLKIKALSSWPKTNKYNLKANWIDATQARNIVNARLIKDAVAITPLEKPAQTGSILSTEGLGQVDGFPIEVYFYDGYHGLYTMNTKKEEKTFNMDNKNPADEVLSNELSAEDFTNTKYTVDGKNWVSEIHDQPSETLKTNLKKFQDFVNTATDEDFKAHIQDYIDVKSVITHILFGQLAHEIDYDTKSQLLATWNDGAYWYLIPYDLDSTWGLYWKGRAISLDDDAFSLTKAISDPSKATKIINDGNKLHERIFKLFKPEFKAQGQKLRATVWSTPNLISKFKAFIDGVPELAYKKDEKFWSDQPGKVWWGTDETHYTGIPSLEITSFTQLQQAIIKRGQEFDQFLASL